MTTVSQHAQNIVALAGQADALIAQLRPILDSIAAEENALHREGVKDGTPFVSGAVSGRRRLAHYARGLVYEPEHSQTVTELATSAWKEFI
ncbi:hypothetical protein [Bradyrhizobium retamae]|uniref:Uncharacterized protein n=1 Tax=Bradyrhizobium retamae TaxID=1300035 RepID=A0A0R3NB17_9BRAD|nr:hypothetical protein [Bradyrhizobium retamae]KRR27503.1 hypothetical protein CQ13_03635 [Bradyrhizobium retamae]